MIGKLFLYSDEDGRIGVSMTPPTATDLYSIGDGRLQVFKISADGDVEGESIWPVIEELDDTGQLCEPDSAVLEQGEEGDNFHIIR